MHSIERELNTQTLLHHDGDEAKRHGDGGGAWYREIITSERRQRHHHGNPGKHVDVLGDECEADETRGDERDVAHAEIERHNLNEARAHEHRQTDEEQEAGYDEREQSRAWSAEVAYRIAWSLQEEKERNGRKQQAPSGILIDHALPQAIIIRFGTDLRIVMHRPVSIRHRLARRHSH